MTTHSQSPSPARPVPSPRSPERVLAEVLAKQKVLKLATVGGPGAPWITGTYFVEEGLGSLFLTLEVRGKGFANLTSDPHVAVAIDGNSPFEAFAQGQGEARLAPEAEAALRLGQLRAKIPEIEPLLQGQLRVVELRMTRWLVTSFPDAMFPAREVVPEGGAAH